MNQKTVFVLWGGLFSLCAALGFIPAPSGAIRVLLTAVSILFFVPPGMLVYGAGKRKDVYTLKLVRNLSALSLAVTLVLLVVNFLLAVTSELLGTIVYYMLVIVSSPMICSGCWVLSLFLWACLLMASMKQLRKT